MDDAASQHAKALKALRADRLGYCVVGIIVGAGMIAFAVFGYWAFERPSGTEPHKLWIMIAAFGVGFIQMGISIWKSKGAEIAELYEQKMDGYHGDNKDLL
jgi:hypothetical protein